MSKLPKRILFLFVIISSGLVLWSVFIRPKPAAKVDPAYLPSNTDNSKVATRDPNITPDKTDQFRIEYGAIKNLLPYEANGVRVIYDSKLGFIVARIKDVKNKEEFLAKKLTVETLFKTKGVRDLCGLGISWFGPDSLKLDLRDKLSPGCTI